MEGVVRKLILTTQNTKTVATKHTTENKLFITIICNLSKTFYVHLSPYAPHNLTYTLKRYWDANFDVRLSGKSQGKHFTWDHNG